MGFLYHATSLKPIYVKLWLKVPAFESIVCELANKHIPIDDGILLLVFQELRFRFSLGDWFEGSPIPYSVVNRSIRKLQNTLKVLQGGEFTE